MLPSMIGRYEIISELGRGGMSTVYVGRDPLSNREVAIKVLPPELLHDETFRARFEREARVIAALEHPAIVPVYDFGESDGRPFFVMRLMIGGALTQKISQGPISLEEVIRILSHIAPALDEAHSRGMIHRDLKPDNILFDQNDESYLADFGIVKLSEAGATLTGNAIVGTPAYMSPEQGRGERDLDGRSDIYSLGAIVFEMLTGYVPFEADTPMGQILKHITVPIPNIRSYRPELPEAVQQVIERALSKRKYGRFVTVLDFTQALDAAATGKFSTDTAFPTMDFSPDGIQSISQDQASRPLAIQPKAIPVPPQAKKQNKKRSKVGLILGWALGILIIIIGGFVALTYSAIPFPGKERMISWLAVAPTATNIPLVTATKPPEPTSTAVQASPTPRTQKLVSPTLSPTLQSSTPTMMVAPTAEMVEEKILYLPVRGNDFPTPQEDIRVDNFDFFTKIGVQGDGKYLDFDQTQDGKILAIGTTTGILIYSWETGQEVAFLPAQSPALDMAFSPDNVFLAAAEEHNTVVWDWQKNELVHTLTLNSEDYVDSVQFSAWGNVLVTGGENTSVWKMENGELLQSFDGVRASMTSISVDGQLIAVPKQQRSIQLFNVVDGEMAAEIKLFGVSQVIFSPDGRVLIALCPDSSTLRFFKTDDWQALGVIDGLAVSLSADGLTIASKLPKGTINIWRYGANGTPNILLQTYSYDTDGDIGMALSKEGTYFAYWYTNQITDDPVAEKFSLPVYRVVDNKRMATYNVNVTWINKAVFTPDELGIISSSNGQMIQLWNLDSQSEEASITRSAPQSQAFSFNSANNLFSNKTTSIISSNGVIKADIEDQNVKVTFVSDGALLRVIEARLASPTDIALSPDGQVLASISIGKIVRVWRVDDGHQVCTIGASAEVATLDGLERVFFSNDGSLIRIYQSDGTLSYWNAKDCSLLAGYHVTGKSISSDRSVFVDFNDTITLRRMDDAKALMILYGPFTDFSFSRDGKLFGAVLWDATTHLWGIKP